jgi:hypothetical protein
LADGRSHLIHFHIQNREGHAEAWPFHFARPARLPPGQILKNSDLCVTACVEESTAHFYQQIIQCRDVVVLRFDGLFPACLRNPRRRFSQLGQLAMIYRVYNRVEWFWW